MPTVLEKIVLMREERKAADGRWRELLIEGREVAKLPWADLAAASGLTIGGVRYYVHGANEKRQAKKRQQREGKT